MFSTFDLTEFGKELKRLRLICGFTQRDVRNTSGIHEDTLRRIENGTVIPRYETLQLLSNIYKIDILELLIDYKKDKDLIAYLERVNEIILNNKKDEFKLLTQQFSTLTQTKNYQFNLCNQDDIPKFRLYLNSISEYFKSTKSGLNAAKKHLEEALSSPNEAFSIQSLSINKYNYFEICMLLLLGIVLSELDEFQSSSVILCFCLQTIEKFNTNSLTRNKIILKLMYNLSYNYHLENLHMEALTMSTKAINIAISLHILYLLPQLYYRKGIAEYNLNNTNYIDSLKKSILLLDVYDMGDLKQEFIKITKDIYQITLE